jgi:FkbM family methyltransferase
LVPVPDLVYDLGCYYGDDTFYYLRKGFRVVAVDANPELVAACQDRFRAEIAAGRVTVLNCCLGPLAGPRTFYRNANPGWSSAEPGPGTRGGTYATLTVPGEVLESVLAAHGVPYFMKIDIEGGEPHCLDSLRRAPAVPPFLSLEIDFYPGDVVGDLARLGYRRFVIVRQPNLGPDEQLPEFEFTPCSSGRFDVGIFRDALDATGARGGVEEVRRGSYQWHDLHAAL